MESRRTTGPGKFFAARPQAMRVSATELVRTSTFAPDCALPLVLEPAMDGLNLTEWAGAHRDAISEKLLQSGGLLFRNFRVDSVEQFEKFAQVVCGELIEYGERSSPRTQIAGRVYTSTDHPSDQHIQLHNEQSYTLNWPMNIAFYCAQPATDGGRTPLADCRLIYQRLNPEIRERFERRGVMYIRNYGEGLGLSWQTTFQTTDRRQVEAHCQAAGIELEWRADDRLRTRQSRPAVRRHPATGERIWFSHAAFFHFSSLPREAQASILEVVGREDVPFDTCYGDGESFAEADIECVREAHEAETRRFDWCQGDILLLDNMLTCHGRESFSGPRKIAVAMCRPFQSLQSEIPA